MLAKSVTGNKTLKASLMVSEESLKRAGSLRFEGKAVI